MTCLPSYSNICTCSFLISRGPLKKAGSVQYKYEHSPPASRISAAWRGKETPEFNYISSQSCIETFKLRHFNVMFGRVGSGLRSSSWLIADPRNIPPLSHTHSTSEFVPIDSGENSSGGFWGFQKTRGWKSKEFLKNVNQLNKNIHCFMKVSNCLARQITYYLLI